MFYDEDFEEIRRRWDPIGDRTCHTIPLDQLVTYDTSKHISNLRMKLAGRPQIVTQSGTMVVYIDGACRGNGTPSARASYGVFFGPNSPHNAYGLLASNLPQTSTRAEIESFIQALDIVRRITDADYGLSKIIIATDSIFLVNAMTEWVQTWIENDGIGSNGQKVAHFDVLKSLHEKLDWMEYSDEGGGREVKFWHLPRELNTEADALANKAFELI